jgi:hypothetical protein
MPHGLNLTIGTSPSPSPSIRDDLRMVKFGLLYGDKIRLCSPAASALVQWGGLKELAKDPLRGEKSQQVALLLLLAVVVTYLSTTSQAKRDAEALRHAAWLGELTPEAATAVTRAVEDLERLHESAEDALSAEGIEADLVELVHAVDSGLAELHPFGWENPEATIRDFVSQITAAVLSGESYPLLDARTGELFSRFIPDPDSAAAAARAARHVHLAVRLFERLPLLEHGSVAELLDVRRELETPLVRFRSAMLTAAEAIAAAPWEPGFAREAESLIIRDVEPAILEIEQKVRDAKIHRHLLKPLAANEWKMSAGGAIAVGVSHLAGAPSLLTGLLGATLPFAPLVHGAVASWRGESEQVERHPFYFYYRLRGQSGTGGPKQIRRPAK